MRDRSLNGAAVRPRRLPDRRAHPLPMLQRKLFPCPSRRKHRNLFCLSSRKKTLNLLYHPSRRKHRNLSCLSSRRKTLNLFYHPSRRKRRNPFLNPSLGKRRNPFYHPSSRRRPKLFFHPSSRRCQHLLSCPFLRMHQNLPLQLPLQNHPIFLPQLRLMNSLYRPPRLYRIKRRDLRRSVRLIPKLHLGMEQPYHKWHLRPPGQKKKR